MNEQINKYLTEAMGECWHELDYDRNAECLKCGKLVAFSSRIKPMIDFFTWTGFGKLMNFLDAEWSDRQIADMLYKIAIEGGANNLPKASANYVYNFLKEREK